MDDIDYRGRIKDKTKKVADMTPEQQAKFGTVYSNRAFLEEHFAGKVEAAARKEHGITIKVKT
jgi:hypothetical protein